VIASLRTPRYAWEAVDSTVRCEPSPPAKPPLWGVSAVFDPLIVPKDPAGNRTAEQIDDAVTGASYNNMNQLVSQQAGGALVFKGTVSEPATVTVGGTPATVTVDNRFEGQASVPEGTGQVDVVATDPSGNVRTSTYEVSQAGTPKSFTYDLNGNMTSDGTRTYEWDAENRLVAVKEGATTVASYTYNHRGLRTAKTVGGVTTTYVLDDDSVVEERLSTGGVRKHFQAPGFDNVLAMQDGAGVVTYLTRDHLGSIREYVDSTGLVTLRRDYDPWGNMSMGAATNGWAYTGREWDGETGLYYYRARYYNPASGAFMSEDPLPWASASYQYVRNNPAKFVDPAGLYVFFPSVNVESWWNDNGKTWLENPKIFPWCRDCGGTYLLTFIVTVRIEARYTVLCPWWSKPHEMAHVSQFLENVKSLADRVLKPKEKEYDSKEACEEAGRAGQREMASAPDEEFDRGHRDRYIYCVTDL
jgi:RHS repeat-associated protein